MMTPIMMIPMALQDINPLMCEPKFGANLDEDLEGPIKELVYISKESRNSTKDRILKLIEKQKERSL